MISWTLFMALPKSVHVVARSVFCDEASSNLLIFTKLSGDCFGKTCLAMTNNRFVKLLW